jgi:hypothetical protein
MIIWRGRGIVVAFFTFGCLVLVDLFTRLTSGNQQYYETHGWPKLVGFWVAAGLVYARRSWLEGEHESEPVAEEIGKKIKPASRSELFFVPVRFWPPILLGLGVVLFFIRD